MAARGPCFPWLVASVSWGLAGLVDGVGDRGGALVV
jgi:hypothetical protein